RLFSDKPALGEPLVRFREVRDIDRDVVTVVRRYVRSLAEDQPLVLADFDHGGAPRAIVLDLPARPDHLLVEAADAIRRALWHCEFDIRNSRADRSKVR